MRRISGAAGDPSRASRPSRIVAHQCSVVMKTKFEIHEKKEMNGKLLSHWYAEIFERNIRQLKLDPDITLEMHRRRKNFDSDVCAPNNVYDGASLMRKAGEYKRIIVNEISAAYAKMLASDGRLPSGKTKEDILLSTLKYLWSDLISITLPTI